MSVVKRIAGSLDIDRFNRSLKKVVERHEILRTSFKLKDGLPVQIVHHDMELKVQIIENNGQDIDVSISEFIKPFDMEKAPLLRIGILKINEKESLLIFDMHHIISDGLSVNILVKDFSDIYNAKELPPIKYQYKDYANWHNRILQSESIKEMEKYWLNKLKDFKYTELPKRELPMDRIKEGDIVVFKVNKDINELVNQYCVKKQVTKFTFLLTVFNIILHKVTGEEDLTIGTPTAGRNNELDTMIGVFINVLVLRSLVKDDMSFKELLDSVNVTVQEALMNEDYQYDELYEKMKQKRSLNNNSLFSILFNYMPLENNEIHLDGVSVSSYGEDKIEPKYDLTLYINETEYGLLCKMVFPKDLLYEETINSIKEDMKKVIEKVCIDEDVLIGTFIKEKKEEEAVFDDLFDNDDFFD